MKQIQQVWKSLWTGAMALAVVLPTAALAQTSGPAEPQISPAPANLESPVPAAQTDGLSPQGQARPSDRSLVPQCGPGEFASAFPDVRPQDWAYEAVNRLAAVPIRCFSDADAARSTTAR